MVYSKKHLKEFPEIMNKEQLRKACHISKRTALYLLQFNLIPHTSTGKKTRCYKIKKSDIIAFMNDRQVNPAKYIAPENWYKYGSSTVKPYKIRIQPELPEGRAQLRKFYEDRLKAKLDLLDVAEVEEFTGYNRRTVGEWIRKGKLRGISLPHKYMIPKCFLLDWLSSEEYNRTNRKSKKHVEMLWEISRAIRTE